MTYNNDDIERFEKRVEDFREGVANDAKKFRKEANRLTVNKREALYAKIQEAYCIGLELLDPANAEMFDKLLGKHGLKRDPRKGSNPWMPVANLLFGKWVEDEEAEDGWRFQPDFSAKKYAPSFRYFQEHGWDRELIVDELRDRTTLELVDFGKLDGKSQKGLIGTEKWGRYEHRDNPDDDQSLEDKDADTTRDRFWNLGTPLGTIKINDMTNRSVDDLEYVALWGIARTDRNPRVIEIYGELRGVEYSRTVKSYLNKAAKELRPFLRKHIREGKPIRKGNTKPKLLHDNILKPLIDAERKQVAVKATQSTPEQPANVSKKPRRTVEKVVDPSQFKAVAERLANDPRRRTKKATSIAA